VKLARVVGNVVSTVRIDTHKGYKLMLVQYLGEDGVPSGSRFVALDCVGAGVGELVLVNTEGGSAKMLMEDENVVSNQTICGIVDFYSESK
jgi:microcompartment protein CcmK/EutM